MNVEQLIEELEKLPKDLPVVLQRDSEGNGYHWLGGVEEAVTEDQDSHYIESVFSLDWTASDCLLEEEEWEVMKENNRCVVLFP